ncbi:MAG: sugar transferase, partial [Marinilabilia sp.]
MNLQDFFNQVTTEVYPSKVIEVSPPFVRPRVDKKKEVILQNIGIGVYEFLIHHLVPERHNVSIINTNSPEDVRREVRERTRSIVNLQQLNDVRYINKFLIEINRSMPDAGIYIGCVEPVKILKERLKTRIRVPFLFGIYWLFVFLFHRVMPKIRYIQKLYFFLTRGRYRFLTMGETLGRIVSCGFEIIEYKEIDGLLYYAVIKTQEPDYGQRP